MVSPQKFVTVWWIEFQVFVLVFADPKNALTGVEHHWWHWAFYGVLLIVDALRLWGTSVVVRAGAATVLEQERRLLEEARRLEKEKEIARVG